MGQKSIDFVTKEVVTPALKSNKISKKTRNFLLKIRLGLGTVEKQEIY